MPVRHFAESLLIAGSAVRSIHAAALGPDVDASSGLAYHDLSAYKSEL